MFESVLIPTDGSERSERAALHGLALASAYDASVHVLSVVETSALDVDPDLDTTDVKTTLEERAEAAIGAIDGLIDDPTLDVVTAVREGNPTTEIQRYAAEFGVDLLVMGTHGRTGVRRFLLGSVTEEVVREATEPVLVARAEDPVKTDYETILVPTDDTPESRAAARYAIDIASRFDATVHAVSVADTRIVSSGPLVESLRTSCGKAVRKVSVQATQHDVPVETRVLQGTPAAEVLDYVGNHAIDFVVIGRHTRSGLDRFVTHSTGERVIRNTEAPVLSVRDGRES